MKKICIFIWLLLFLTACADESPPLVSTTVLPREATTTSVSVKDTSSSSTATTIQKTVTTRILSTATSRAVASKILPICTTASHVATAIATTTTATATSSVAKTTAETTLPVATQADAPIMAEKLTAVINRYRAEIGAPPLCSMPGLTAYAQIRSQQLTANFAHDTDDERAAATLLQYGTYIDPSDYGIVGEPYYTAKAAESIAMIGHSWDIDATVHEFAVLIRNSAPHWYYVGGASYRYIGIGFTLVGQTWYCDVACQENSPE